MLDLNQHKKQLISQCYQIVFKMKYVDIFTSCIFHQEYIKKKSNLIFKVHRHSSPLPVTQTFTIFHSCTNSSCELTNLVKFTSSIMQYMLMVCILYNILAMQLARWQQLYKKQSCELTQVRKFVVSISGSRMEARTQILNGSLIQGYSLPT